MNFNTTPDQRAFIAGMLKWDENLEGLIAALVNAVDVLEEKVKALESAKPFEVREGERVVVSPRGVSQKTAYFPPGEPEPQVVWVVSFTRNGISFIEGVYQDHTLAGRAYTRLVTQDMAYVSVTEHVLKTLEQL